MRAGYEVFNESGFDISVFRADAEWHQRPQLPDARIDHGHEEIARMSAEFMDSFEGHVWSCHNGLVSEVREYLTKDAALNALGADG